MPHSYFRALSRFALTGGAFLLTLAAHAALAADSTVATPPASSAPAPLAGNHYQGSITSVDATTKTFVLEKGYTDTPTTVTTDPGTTFQAMKNIGLEALKVGDRIFVRGKISVDQATVTTKQIQLMAANATGKMKISKRGVRGTVATTAPALTITTGDGKTVAVATEGKVKVMAPRSAVFADLAVGNEVDVKGTPDGMTFHATDVTVTSPHPHHPKGAKAPAPPSETSVPDAATDPVSTP